MKIFSFLMICAATLLSLPAIAQADFGEQRTLFVDRFDFPFTGNITTMTNQINGIMQDAVDEGFTDIVWQVRGRGDALYNSNFEPAAAGMTSGFDPLQTALNAAHSRGLKVHAWFNSTTLWNTTNINPPSSHIFNNTNPSFRLRELNGNLEPQAGWGNFSYSSVNPILPEVHTHLNNVVNDVATNYAVDGIHLDYIRYIPGTSNFDRLPHDSLSHQMFNAATGLDGSSPANATAYENYIAGRITDLVASISQTVNTAETSTGRTMEYSASVWRDPDVGVNDYMQDYRTWLENDYFDIMMPMIYLSDSNDGTFFNDNLLNTMSIPTNTQVRPTLASYLHIDGGGGAALTRSQIERAFLMGADGINFYDQPAYFNGYSSGERASIKALLDSFGDPNASGLGNSLEDFEIDEGAFYTSPSFSGSTEGILTSSTSERVTTEAQSGGGSQEIVINADPNSTDWFVRHLAGGGNPGNNDAFTSEGFIGFWLKTDDPGITVQIALDDPSTADRGFLQPVQADGEWHLYQWNLEDDRQWEGWFPSNDGNITGTAVTIDSIQFYGSGDATIYLDTISHNPDGFLAGLVATDPTDFDGDGDVDGQDLSKWISDYGVNSDSDADDDGDTDGADFLAWQQAYAPSGSTVASSTVPEPGAALLLLVALTGPVVGTRKLH